MKPIKIVRVEDMHVAGGFRGCLSYLKFETDAGIVGWSEYNDEYRTPTKPSRTGLTMMVRELAQRLVGMNALDTTAIEIALRGSLFRPHYGFEQYAIGALVNGCLDIKAKALDVRVCDLFGGPARDALPLYWSHCATYRAIYPECIDAAPVTSLEDVRAVGREVREKGFRALKTNEIGASLLDGGPSFKERLSLAYPRRVAYPGLFDGITELLTAFREGAGSDVHMILDVHALLKTPDMRTLAKVVEPFDLLWLEFDNLSPADLAHIRWSTSTRVGSGETLLGARDLYPYLTAAAFDVCVIDVQYVGLPEAMRMAALADAFDVNVAAHNAYSGLSTLFGAHMCAAVPNLAIMEYDVDQPRWMSEILSHPPTIFNGEFELPTRPGWGCDVLEEGVLANPPPENPAAPWLLDYHRTAGAA